MAAIFLSFDVLTPHDIWFYFSVLHAHITLEVGVVEVVVVAVVGGHLHSDSHIWPNCDEHISPKRYNRI